MVLPSFNSPDKISYTSSVLKTQWEHKSATKKRFGVFRFCRIARISTRCSYPENICVDVVGDGEERWEEEGGKEDGRRTEGGREVVH
jgi:hypothetical protein